MAKRVKPHVEVARPRRAERALGAPARLLVLLLHAAGPLEDNNCAVAVAYGESWRPRLRACLVAGHVPPPIDGMPRLLACLVSWVAGRPAVHGHVSVSPRSGSSRLRTSGPLHWLR